MSNLVEFLLITLNILVVVLITGVSNLSSNLCAINENLLRILSHHESINDNLLRILDEMRYK